MLREFQKEIEKLRNLRKMSPAIVKRKRRIVMKRRGRGRGKETVARRERKRRKEVKRKRVSRMC